MESNPILSKFENPEIANFVLDAMSCLINGRKLTNSGVNMLMYFTHHNIEIVRDFFRFLEQSLPSICVIYKKTLIIHPNVKIILLEADTEINWNTIPKANFLVGGIVPGHLDIGIYRRLYIVKLKSHEITKYDELLQELNRRYEDIQQKGAKFHQI